MAMTIPKCAIKGCECNAAINEYYPNSEGGQYWTLCEKCYEEDQEEESEIEFDTDKMDQALNDDGLDWTLDEPTDDTKYVCVYVIKK